jgi:hypothetical protein
VELDAQGGGGPLAQAWDRDPREREFGTWEVGRRPLAALSRFLQPQN